LGAAALFSLLDDDGGGGRRSLRFMRANSRMATAVREEEKGAGLEKGTCLSSFPVSWTKKLLRATRGGRRHGDKNEQDLLLRISFILLASRFPPFGFFYPRAFIKSSLVLLSP